MVQNIPRAYFFVALLLMPISSSWGWEIEARLQWAKRLSLSFPVSGVIDKIRVRPGDRVKKGAVLASLAPATFDAHAKAAKAVLTQRSREQKEAEREFQRNQALYDRTLLSDRDLQEAQIRYAQAQAAFAKAKAASVSAQWERKHSVLYAPFAALVLARHAQPAETTLAHCQPAVVLVLVAEDQMLAYAEVTEASLGALQRGQKGEAWLGERRFAAELRHIGLEPLQKEQRPARYSLEMVIPLASTKGLRSGQKVRLQFEDRPQ